MLYLFISAAIAGEFQESFVIIVPSNEPLASVAGIADLFPGHEDITVESSVPGLACSIRDGAVIVEFWSDVECLVPEEAVCSYDGNTLILTLDTVSDPIGEYNRWDIVEGNGVSLSVLPHTLALYSYELPEGSWHPGPGQMLTASGTPWYGMGCFVRAWPDHHSIDIEVFPGAAQGSGTCNGIPVTLAYD